MPAFAAGILLSAIEPFCDGRDFARQVAQAAAIAESCRSIAKFASGPGRSLVRDFVAIPKHVGLQMPHSRALAFSLELPRRTPSCVGQYLGKSG
jgi:hypothetical protein